MSIISVVYVHSYIRIPEQAIEPPRTAYNQKTT